MRFCLKTARTRGLTLLEVMIAVFVLMMGVLGVLAAVPSGIHSGITVVFQDCAIHLAHSKLAEFRRDRINPRTDLLEGSAYLAARHEPLNASGTFRDFAHGEGETYEHFDDIQRYEWKVDESVLQNAAVSADVDAATALINTPALSRVRVIVRMKGSNREHQYSHYFYCYEY
jgi:Tfp pilus assembly protein PilV